MRIYSESPVFIFRSTVYLPPCFPPKTQSLHPHSHYSVFPKCTWNLSISLEAVNHGLITAKEEEQKITWLRFKGSREEDDSKQQQQGVGFFFGGFGKLTLRHCHVYTCGTLKLGKTHLYSIMGKCYPLSWQKFVFVAKCFLVPGSWLKIIETLHYITVRIVSWCHRQWGNLHCLLIYCSWWKKVLNLSKDSRTSQNSDNPFPKHLYCSGESSARGALAYCMAWHTNFTDVSAYIDTFWKIFIRFLAES